MQLRTLFEKDSVYNAELFLFQFIYIQAVDVVLELFSSVTL